ncbi:hypothetical protein [Nocardia sp. NPDC052566]|uniref:hypothetical protein n=1 Tax=Nocardia sp. NPDC052566 TaxID=3364330 RepID=UPI0037CC1EF7
MTLERTGEPEDDSAPWHDPRCRSGWLGHDNEYRPLPCPVCRPHTIRRSTVHDFAEHEPSARARAAIEQDNRNA